MIPDMTIIEKMLMLKIALVVAGIMAFWSRVIRPLQKERDGILKWRIEVNGKIDRLQEKMDMAEKDHQHVHDCVHGIKNDITEMKISLARIEEQIKCGGNK